MHEQIMSSWAQSGSYTMLQTERNTKHQLQMKTTFSLLLLFSTVCGHFCLFLHVFVLMFVSILYKFHLISYSFQLLVVILWIFLVSLSNRFVSVSLVSTFM